VAVCFIIGITASLVADARDPDADAKRAEREKRTESAPEEAGEPVEPRERARSG
jgi:hypothetical protein